MAGDMQADIENEFSDREIGLNVTVLRGDRTQKAIADEMGNLGVKWSQTTVWEIEQGKRSLKAREVMALAHVLKVPVQNLFGQSVMSQMRNVIESRIRKVKAAEIAASSAVEKYALARTQALALAQESLTELDESGVDHDEALWLTAKHLQRLATKTLEEALDERARAITEAKKTFGDGYTLKFHPGHQEIVREDGTYYGLIEMLPEEEADGFDQETS
ncbi:helix-turn-helix domain-containing protein [Arthrobacter sp. TMN-50]